MQTKDTNKISIYIWSIRYTEINIFLLVRLTHFLPSGKYQLAMVPYQKNEDQILSPMAKPSCSCRLERLDLGKHALSVILSKSCFKFE